MLGKFGVGLLRGLGSGWIGAGGYVEGVAEASVFSF